MTFPLPSRAKPSEQRICYTERCSTWFTLCFTMTSQWSIGVSSKCQVTARSIVCWRACQCWLQKRKHRSASLLIILGLPWGESAGDTADSPHKGSVTRKVSRCHHGMCSFPGHLRREHHVVVGPPEGTVRHLLHRLCCLLNRPRTDSLHLPQL